MKQKLLTTALCLLLTGLSYSQNAFINEETGDTLVAITINKMDDIYVELIQKDSLSAQARINALRETKHLKLIDSANKDIKSLKTQVNSLRATNRHLFSEQEESLVKVKRNRAAAIYGWSVVFLATFICLLN